MRVWLCGLGLRYQCVWLQGLADSTHGQVSLVDIRNVMWLGEITRGSCSMFGAKDSATQESRGGKLLQLRALDWDTDGPFKNHASIVVYHPEPGQGNAWANVGFHGWTGSISGFSEKQLAMSEIGVSYPDATFGKETYLAKGYPFSYIIRDMLQFDDTLAAATNRITQATRTCDLILGVGDGKTNDFSGFQCECAPHCFVSAFAAFRFFSLPFADKDTLRGRRFAAHGSGDQVGGPPPGQPELAPEDKGRGLLGDGGPTAPVVVHIASVATYWSERKCADAAQGRCLLTLIWCQDWICPNDNRMLAHQLQKLHGKITAENTISDITSYVGTGDVHTIIYDHAGMKMFVATARPDGGAGPLPAYQRQFTALDMAALFAEKPPVL